MKFLVFLTPVVLIGMLSTIVIPFWDGRANKANKNHNHDMYAGWKKTFYRIGRGND